LREGWLAQEPHNDVSLIEGTLHELDFKVTLLKDASYKVMDSALKLCVTGVRRAGQGAISFFLLIRSRPAQPRVADQLPDPDRHCGRRR
jgi:hypothetical protein